MRIILRPLALSLLLLAALAASAAAAPPPDSYIVVLKDGEDSRSVADEHRRNRGAKVEHVYSHALNGYSARLRGQDLAAVRSDPRVDYVEADGEAQASTTQSNATWGLDRIDQRPLPLDTNFTYTDTGSGVTAYIIDTGIRFDHAEFGGRAVDGFDAVDGRSGDDCNGHGTHVAGTVGGATYGVAKGVSLVAVRVLDCSGSGSWSGVIAGMDWVTGNHAPGTPAVANMSLGGGASTAVDDAVRRSIASGVSYAIAAGNGNQAGKAQDACRYSPARVTEAMTIGATDRTDTKTSWSNYGNCVDWFAPGLGITSSWYTSSTATNTISGTSMATPHTAGVAALYLQRHGTETPQQVRDALLAATTKTPAVKSAKSANAYLLFTNY